MAFLFFGSETNIPEESFINFLASTETLGIRYLSNIYSSKLMGIQSSLQDEIDAKQQVAAQPAIAYYTARLLNDEITDPQINNKKGARL